MSFNATCTPVTGFQSFTVVLPRNKNGNKTLCIHHLLATLVPCYEHPKPEKCTFYHSKISILTPEHKENCIEKLKRRKRISIVQRTILQHPECNRILKASQEPTTYEHLNAKELESLDVIQQLIA